MFFQVPYRAANDRAGARLRKRSYRFLKPRRNFIARSLSLPLRNIVRILRLLEAENGRGGALIVVMDGLCLLWWGAYLNGFNL